MKLKAFIERIREVGINPHDTMYQQKMERIFNLLCFYGFIWACVQACIYIRMDIVASLCHLGWGITAIFCLLLRSTLGFKVSRLILFSVITFTGSYAAARIGNETLAHFPVITVYVALFIFFDIKRERTYIVSFFLIISFAIFLIDSNALKVVDIPVDQIATARMIMFIGSILFITIEIILLVTLSTLNENAVSDKLIKQNEELIQLNNEKTVLLQEVHHRVKNNFQIISSLLKLQAADINDSTVNTAFNEAINRINAISQLHEQIYQSDSIADLDLKSYLENIAHTMIKNHSISKEVSISIESISIKLNNDNILPLALIFHELISNSLKHAFKNQDTGMINVSVNRFDKSNFTFTYSDNGKWETVESSKSFGLELIDTLSNQLDGDFQRTINDEGTHYFFQLKLNY